MNPDQTANYSSTPGGPREERSYSLVLFSGLATTALTLGGVYLLDTQASDFVIMGWYADYVLPVGAIIVGLAASTGYGIASWYSGIKITRNLLWIVLLFQFIAYFVAQYIEFRNLHLVYHNGESISFLKYYDFAARSFAWKQQDGTMGQPLGLWGYCFRGLEILGFLGGGLAVPLALRKAPYCSACQRYMKTRQLALVPGCAPLRKVKKSDLAGTAAAEQEQQAVLQAAEKTLTTMQELATAANTHEFQKKLAELEPGKKSAAKLRVRFGLSLVHCKQCHDGQYVATRITGQGNQVKKTEISRTSLHPEFVRALVTP